MPEIILKEEETKSFSDIYPFELFQLIDGEGIWTKVHQKYARRIDQRWSSGKCFQPDQIVTLLISNTAEDD
ncbi:hypothetical protein C7H19_24715 [Aphanothece hegewaldii CCALA 016]|uniref:Uncharacterized protein n=1 Tax=Aphanothece hegewaldii CCALA 016 TaxID=2107694 RepID=A0A2T1LQK1_9CHRO|nr:hypothetical protein [Aphanothece hegewaldii]PSF28337.1 hypothetical protein C7H19_24715 [Aphanothece hegewaldii CCALA 016]